MVHVDPEQLDAYAGQVDRNAGYFIAPLREHCGRHCTGTSGLTGMLFMARPVVDLAHDGSAEILSSGERHLLQVAANLRAAASAYRLGDAEAAERIWRMLPQLGPPTGYEEVDDHRHPGDYRDVVVPAPMPPPAIDDLTPLAEEVRVELGFIGSLGRRLGVDVPDLYAEWISGDWSGLRRIAHSYATLAGPDGAGAIGLNLRHGMDSLSSSWDSPAALTFDFQIRRRWLPAIEALQRLFTMHKEAFEALAQQAENVFRLLRLAIITAKRQLVVYAVRALTGIVGGPVADALHAAGVIRRVVYYVDIGREAIDMSIEAALEAIQLAGAEAAVIEDVWGTPGGSRLTPLLSG